MRYQMKQIIVMVLLLFVSLSSFAEYDEDSGIERQQIYHVYEDVDLIPKLKFRYAKNQIIVKITYPLLESGDLHDGVEVFNQLVTDLIQEQIDTFKEQVAEVPPSQLADKKLKNELTIDFDSSVLNANSLPIISVRFNIQGYIPALDKSYHHHRVINFDLDAAQEILLDELFAMDSNYLDMIAHYSRQVLNRKASNQTLLFDGTAPRLENYQNWNLGPHGLLITFDEYQVAPKIQGTQTVLIPYSAFKHLMLPDTFVSDCIKTKKCLRNHILTGGFIDGV